MLVFSLNFYSFQRLNNALLRFLHVNRVNVSPIYLFACIVIEVYFIKFEEKGRSRISAYLAKIKHNLQKKKLNYWHNFRNILCHFFEYNLKA